MKYLGIDPGTTAIGYGVIEDDGNTLTPIIWGILKNTEGKIRADKAATARELTRLIQQHKPDRAGVERLFFMNNQRTAMAVAEMRGVILLTLAQRKIPIHEFTPQQVKQTICGYGKAEKKQVQQMVRMALRMKEIVRPDDAADALALALCCATIPKQKTY